MSRRARFWIPVAVVLLIVAAAIWFGGAAIWRLLLAMHGRR